MSLKHVHTAVISICLLLPGLAVEAANDRYGASLVASTWSMQDSKGQCTLSHSIPQLGVANFIQAPGKPLAFSVMVPQESQFAQQVSWRVRPLPWKHGAEPFDLGRQALSGNSKTLQLSAEESQRLYLELEKGMSVDFVFSDGAEDPTAITVSLSAVRFTGQTQAFQTCIAGLIKFADNGKVQTGKITLEFKIPFKSNSYELGDAARTILGDRARDYRISKSRSRILITGYTDSQESADTAANLAHRRAREIKGYLVRRGLPADLIEMRSSGKQVATNSNSADELPRATIWLVN